MIFVVVFDKLSSFLRSNIPNRVLWNQEKRELNLLPPSKQVFSATRTNNASQFLFGARTTHNNPFLTNSHLYRMIVCYSLLLRISIPFHAVFFPQWKLKFMCGTIKWTVGDRYALKIRWFLCWWFRVANEWGHNSIRDKCCYACAKCTRRQQMLVCMGNEYVLLLWRYSFRQSKHAKKNRMECSKFDLFHLHIYSHVILVGICLNAHTRISVNLFHCKSMSGVPVHNIIDLVSNTMVRIPYTKRLHLALCEWYFGRLAHGLRLYTVRHVSWAAHACEINYVHLFGMRYLYHVIWHQINYINLYTDDDSRYSEFRIVCFVITNPLPNLCSINNNVNCMRHSAPNMYEQWIRLNQSQKLNSLRTNCWLQSNRPQRHTEHKLRIWNAL